MATQPPYNLKTATSKYQKHKNNRQKTHKNKKTT
mgnify:CR=1 FL=1